MTLVISVLSHHGLWQLTDHKLTGGRHYDPSMKHVYLEAKDGKALIAYAGIGQVGDTQLSKWIRNVLHGQRRTLEDHLSLLRDAADRRILPISKRLNKPHIFSIAAYKDAQPIFYGISNLVQHSGELLVGDRFDYRGIRLGGKNCQVVVNLEGQGALAISDFKVDRAIIKTIRRRARKPSLGKDVTAVLASLNAEASKNPMSLISSNCLVAYLASPAAGVVTRFCGWDPLAKRLILQHITGEFDVTSIVEAIMPVLDSHLTRMLEARKRAEPLDEKAFGDALQETLRRSYRAPSDEFE